MKKLILATAISSALLTSIGAFAEENEFYIKAQAGASFLKTTKNKVFNIKMHSKAIGILGLGAGYYVMDNVRADLTLNFFINPQLKKTFDKNGISTIIKQKGNIIVLLVNGYVDVFDAEVAKLFVGAGVGCAQVKETIRFKPEVVQLFTSPKKANNLAYQLTIGGSAEISDRVAAELAYSWRDYGKTKKVKENPSVGNTAYRGHNIIAGIRFSI